MSKVKRIVLTFIIIKVNLYPVLRLGLYKCFTVVDKVGLINSPVNFLCFGWCKFKYARDIPYLYVVPSTRITRNKNINQGCIFVSMKNKKYYITATTKSLHHQDCGKLHYPF